MSKLQKFISSLSDHEIAIFWGYRYDRFLKNSQLIINNEIRKRGLNNQKLYSLKNEKIISDRQDAECCQRCGSNKLFIETEYEEIPISEFSSAEIAIDSYRCSLCNFNAYKTPPKNLFERIARLLKKNRKKRINRWNEI